MDHHERLHDFELNSAPSRSDDDDDGGDGDLEYSSRVDEHAVLPLVLRTTAIAEHDSQLGTPNRAATAGAASQDADVKGAVAPAVDAVDPLLSGTSVTSQKSTTSTGSGHGISVTGDAFNVLSEDKRVMLSIPADIVEQTLGSQNYLAQGRNANTSFRFHLCKKYAAGVCQHGRMCGFIHSRHVLEPELAVRIASTKVHVNQLLQSLSEALYDRHPPGMKLPILDSKSRALIQLDASDVYITKGSAFAVESLGKARGFSVRLQFCLHYEKGLCARGNKCNFIHRVMTTSVAAAASSVSDGASSASGATVVATLHVGGGHHHGSVANGSFNAGAAAIPSPPSPPQMMQSSSPIAVVPAFAGVGLGSPMFLGAPSNASISSSHQSQLSSGTSVQSLLHSPNSSGIFTGAVTGPLGSQSPHVVVGGVAQQPQQHPHYAQWQPAGAPMLATMPQSAGFATVPPGVQFVQYNTTFAAQPHQPQYVFAQQPQHPLQQQSQQQSQQVVRAHPPPHPQQQPQQQQPQPQPQQQPQPQVIFVVGPDGSLQPVQVMGGVAAQPQFAQFQQQSQQQPPLHSVQQHQQHRH